MKQVLILVGLSGSGKSTFARQFCAEQPNWIRVNRDDLRRGLLSVSLADYWKTWPEQEINRVESLVNDLQTTAILNGLARGWHVLIDNTNLKLSYLNDYRRMLTRRFAEVKIQYKLIEAPLDECIRRDRNRPDTVGEDVIRQQAERLSRLKSKFFFQTEVLTRSTVAHRVQDENLPRCIVVDIDGTIALRGDRSPFDWHRVGTDTPRWPVIRLVQTMQAAGYAIVFLSGRDAVCRTETTAWINWYLGWSEADYELFMRPTKDNRTDSHLKRELFEKHLVGRYYVELVVDDRQQVVDMWRQTLGLTCLQVDYGDF